MSGEQLASFSGVAAVLRFPCTLEELLGDEHDGYDDDDDGGGGSEDGEDGGGGDSGGEAGEAAQGVPHGVVRFEEGY